MASQEEFKLNKEHKRLNLNLKFQHYWIKIHNFDFLSQNYKGKNPFHGLKSNKM